jgi:hypothetical protein
MIREWVGNEAEVVWAMSGEEFVKNGAEGI